MYPGDKELAEKCAKGDAEAKELLYRRYAQPLYAICCRYASDNAMGRDLMHDAVIKAYDRISRFEYRGEGSLFSWLARLTVGVCVDDLRKRKRFRTVALDYGPDIEDEGPPPDVGAVPSDVLMTFISELPEVRRMIFNMYYIDGLSHKEIAALTGITQNASTSMAAKARKMLSEKIKGYLENNG